MRFDGTDRRTHLAVTGKTGLLAGRARSGRPDRCLARRPLGAGSRHQPTLPARPPTVRRRGTQGFRARADRTPQEAHRHRGRLRRVGRRRQDDHLGHRRQLLPLALRFNRLRPAQKRRRRKGGDKAESRSGTKGTEAQARGNGRRHRAAEAPPARDGRPQRGQGDHDAGRRGDRRGRHRRDRPPDRGRRDEGFTRRSPREPRSST